VLKDTGRNVVHVDCAGQQLGANLQEKLTGCLGLERFAGLGGDQGESHRPGTWDHRLGAVYNNLDIIETV
jgi:hypothetical protein